MFSFDLQRFGGKGGYQSSPAVVQEMTPDQKRTIQLQNQYLESTAPVLQSLVQKGNDALSGYQAPNFNQYAQQGMDITQNAMGMNRSLADGILPSAYKANVTQAVADAMQPFQQQFNQLGVNGTINSSLMRTLAGDMSRGATAAANSAINQSLASASQLTGAYGSSANAPLAYQTNLYNAQTQPAKDFLTLGTSTYQPTGQAAGQAYQWQTAMSAPAQNQYVQQPGFGGVLGSIAGGLAGNAGLFGRR